MRRTAFVVVFAASILLGNLNAPRAMALPDWSTSGIFVFDALVLDLVMMREQYSPAIQYGLADCSTDEFICVSVRGVFNFVLPRTCGPVRVGDVWQVGDTNTVVLGRRVYQQRDPLHPTGPDDNYFLGDASNPYVVYEYHPEWGIYGLYWDIVRDTDLVALVMDGGLVLEYENRNSESLLRHFSLTTLELLGPCRG